MFREICDAIIHSIRKQIPVCRARVDLIRLRKAEGRSARHKYSHIKEVARYANLDTMKVEQLLIILTLKTEGKSPGGGGRQGGRNEGRKVQEADKRA